MNYDKDKYKAWKLPHPLLLHWIINPGLAVNELILGQRIPKLTLIDKKSPAPFMERQYVPCQECGALNDAASGLRAMRWVIGSAYFALSVENGFPVFGMSQVFYCWF